MGFFQLDPESPKRDPLLQRLEQMLGPAPRAESRAEPRTFKPDPHQFALHLRPPLRKLAIVLVNFNQTIMTCPDMPRGEILAIVHAVDGNVPDDVITLAADEYITDHFNVRNGFRPKFDKYPNLHDVKARCLAAMNITNEVAALSSPRPASPSSSPADRAQREVPPVLTQSETPTPAAPNKPPLRRTVL